MRTSPVSNSVDETPESAVFFQCCIFLLASFIVRNLIAWKLPVSLDETYYFFWGCNPQLSYYDHPPMIAYFIYPFHLLFKYHVLAIRECSILSFLILSLVVWKWVSKMFGESIALKSVILINLTIPFGAGSLISTPDTPLALFWILSSYLVYNAIFESTSPSWYLAGITAGLGLLSKYTMVLFVLIIFIFIFSNKSLRSILKKKDIYLGLVISILLFTPVIIWNYQNDWISFFFQFSHGLSTEPSLLTARFIGPYLAQQIGMLTPLLFFGILISVIAALRGTDLRKKYLAIFPMIAFMFFGLCSLKARSEANWTVVGFITGIILFTTHFAGNKAGKKKKQFWNITFASCIIVTLIIHIQPFYKILPIPLRADITNKLIVGKTVSVQVEKHLKNYPDDIILMSDSHQISSALHFFLPEHPIIYEINETHRYPWLNNSKRDNKNALIIVRSSTRKLKKWYRYAAFFDEYKFVDRISVKVGNVEIKSYELLYGKRFDKRGIYQVAQLQKE